MFCYTHIAYMDALLSFPLQAQVIFQGGGLPEGIAAAGGISWVSYMTLPPLILKAIMAVINLLGLLAAVVIVICGILYIISIGNEEMARKARTGILYSVIGLLIVLFAKAIVTLVTSLAS